MEASRNIFFSHLLTIETLKKTVKSVDLGFCQRRGKTMLFAQLGQASSTLCVKHKKALFLLGQDKK